MKLHRFLFAKFYKENVCLNERPFQFYIKTVRHGKAIMKGLRLALWCNIIVLLQKLKYAGVLLAAFFSCGELEMAILKNWMVRLN